MQYGKAARKEEGEQPKPQIKDTSAPVEVEPASKQGALPTEIAQPEPRVQEAEQEFMRLKQVAETTARQAEEAMQAEQEATRLAQEAQIVARLAEEKELRAQEAQFVVRLAEEKALLAQREEEEMTRKAVQVTRSAVEAELAAEQGALPTRDTIAPEGQQPKRQKKVPAPKGGRDGQRIPTNTEVVGASPENETPEQGKARRKATRMAKAAKEEAEAREASLTET